MQGGYQVIALRQAEQKVVRETSSRAMEYL